jgi:hypothetical protein
MKGDPIFYTTPLSFSRGSGTKIKIKTKGTAPPSFLLASLTNSWQSTGGVWRTSSPKFWLGGGFPVFPYSRSEWVRDRRLSRFPLFAKRMGPGQAFPFSLIREANGSGTGGVGPK